jgi:hypothetical protein
MKNKQIFKKIFALSICIILVSQISFFSLTSAQIDNYTTIEKITESEKENFIETSDPVINESVSDPVINESVSDTETKEQFFPQVEESTVEDSATEEHVIEKTFTEPDTTLQSTEPLPEKIEKDLVEPFYPENTETSDYEEPAFIEPEYAPIPSTDFKEPFYQERTDEEDIAKPFYNEFKEIKNEIWIPELEETVTSKSEYKPPRNIDMEHTVYPEGATPPVCIEAGIISQPECERLMKEKFEEERKDIEPFYIKNDFDEKIKNEFFNFGPTEKKFLEPPKIEFFSESELKNEKDSLPYECKQKGIENKEECFGFIKTFEDVPFQCKERGITDMNECEKIMKQINLPPECQKAGFLDFEECKRNIGKSFLPPECIKEGASTEEECERIMKQKSLPPECREAGITDMQECEKMFFNRNMPYECIEAGVTSYEECEEIMMIKHMPPECREAGITDMQECDKMVMLMHMPSPCQEKGITSPEECEKIMMELHMPPECKEAGVTDMRECEKMLSKNARMPELRQKKIVKQ